MKSFIRNLTLKKKIESIVFLCVFLLAAVSQISIHLTTLAHQKVLYQAVAASLSVSSKELENRLGNVSIMADMLLADNTMQKNLGILKDTPRGQIHTVAYKSIYTTLNEYYFNFHKNSIKNMSLIQRDNYIHTHIMNGDKLPDSVQKDLIKRAEAAKGKTIWITDYSDNYGLFLVKNIRRTQFFKLDSVGNLIVNIDMKQLMDTSIDSNLLYEEANYILLDQGNSIYNSSGISKQATAKLKERLYSKYGLLDYENKNYFYVLGGLSDFPWDYVCLIPYDKINSSLRETLKLCIFLTAAAILTALALSTALINSIMKHFNYLLVKMQNFAEGQNSDPGVPYDYTGRTDELGILHTRFDQMVENVNQLIRTNYLNEILKKEAQLKALENQINPHFLYNTLESINWRAKSVGAADISSMAENLGTLLRITLDQANKEVCLKRELELITCYMTIQKYRYEDRLEYKIEVKETLLSCMVLKLTLQPLVENSIRYGLEENTEGCQILIRAECDDTTLWVYVKNNGSVFEDDLLEKLKTNQIPTHGFGIGLLNILERMKLTYGEGFGLTLYNENDQAVARLAFPLRGKEDSYA